MKNLFLKWNFPHIYIYNNNNNIIIIILKF